MRQVELTLEPTKAFVIPSADGYQVYGALLSALDNVAADVSERVHDSQLGSLHNSGLFGSFRGCDRILAEKGRVIEHEDGYSLD